MSINPLRSIIDQLRTRIIAKAKAAIQATVYIITIEEILKDECWLVRHGDTGMTMYTIRDGEFYSLTAEDMGFRGYVDTYVERYAGAVLRSRLGAQQGNGDAKTP